MSKTKGIGGSIHRIREFELEKVSLADEFDILQIVGEGWFGKILLVEHKATDTEMVLKALPKPYTALRDFYREFHYGLHLGAHKNIISTYDVSFETAGFYVFSQEYAPLGDLTSNVQDTGIGELHTKRVAKQLASALEHLHTRDLVHRDVKLDNILVFKSDFSRIKLCDFGETRRVGSQVPRRNEWLPYAPPEVLRVKPDNDYTAVTSHDVWQFGIVIFVCLTGCLPWQKAALDDPRYQRYLTWHLSTMKLGRQPKLFKLISSKGQRIFKKYLEPRTEKRPHGLAELSRYIDDRWLSKVGIEKNNEVPDEEEGLCPSMYSFHSSPEEKNKLLYSLTQYGLETTVDRSAKKDRIRDWIQSSVIEEEDEEEYEEEEDTDEDIQIKDHHTGPAGEIGNRGPVGERKISNGHVTLERKVSRRNSTVSIRKMPEVYSPPIDPRIPLEQQQDKIKLQVEEMRHIKATQPPPVVKSASLDESDSNWSNESSASNVNFEHFGLQNALPFQNIKVNQSNNSLDSNSSIKHRINIQEPQAQQYTIPVQAQENTAQKRGYPVPVPTKEYPVQSNENPVQSNVYPVQPNVYPVQSNVNPIQPNMYPVQPNVYSVQPNVYPAQPAPAPRINHVHTRDQPTQPKEYPAQPRVQPREHPAQPKEYPAQKREYPSQPREYPQQPREYPQQPREYPQQPREYPQQPREYPQQPREYPQQPREYTTQPHEYPTPPKPQEDPKIQEYHKHPTAPHRNGHTRSKYERKPTSPIPPKRSVREDKRFGAYGNYGSKSSSSNSNNSTEKTNK